jgi:thiamine biosynthesis lipoprotein
MNRWLNISRIGRLAVVVILVSLVGCVQPSSKGEYVRVEGFGIGTTYRIIARAESGSVSEIRQAAEDVFAEMTASMSIFDSTSLVSRVNRNATDSADRHITQMISLARGVNAISGGMYDVTVAPLTEAYGFAGGVAQQQPNVDSLLEFVGMEKVQIEEGRIIKSDPRVRLDFNSIAKGYTVDCIAAEIEQMGIADYMVEVGGEIVCRGRNPKGGAWRIAVDSPYDGNMNPGENCQVIIAMSDRALATSGNYRRYYIDNEGRKIAHTINPLTGESAITDLLSATVIAPTAAEADALGTMCMSLGLERAKQVISDLEGVDAYLISVATEGSESDFNVWYTPAMEQLILR